MIAIDKTHIIQPSDCVLVTGAAGFIGSRVVASLLQAGYRNIRCLARPSSNVASIQNLQIAFPDASISIERGNLLSKDDCTTLVQGVSLILHLAAGRGEKSFPDAFVNTVVATRNLLEATAAAGCVNRFVCVSSFAVYSTATLKRGGAHDESCPIEALPHLSGEAYTYAKGKQEEIVREYGRTHGINYVFVRPGVVYGPGNKGLTGRVGIGTFGVFMHLGGSNRIPLTFVDNCADAIVLAGLVKGIDSEAFNIVDDELPTSRKLLGQYKKNVRRFRSVFIPYHVGYFLSYLWERYSAKSEGQLPPLFNRRRWVNYWKGVKYSNQKAKTLLGWQPRVLPDEGLRRYFEYQRQVA